MLNAGPFWHNAGFVASTHWKYMQLALQEAEKGGQEGEVPVGAVLVAGSGKILAKAHNQTIWRTDPCAHAEVLAMRAGARAIGNYRLLDTTLYVTIEPCLMCMGALIHARVAGLFFGAPDPRWGGAGSLYDFSSDGRLNHRVEVIGGIGQDEARQLMQDFFRQKRREK
jgi:tRNA(adenine34) deaminase